VAFIIAKPFINYLGAKSFRKLVILFLWWLVLYAWRMFSVYRYQVCVL